jgi:hypothetical protein
MPRIRLFHWVLVSITVSLSIGSGSFLPATAQRQESQDVEQVFLLDAAEPNIQDTSGMFLDVRRLGTNNNAVTINNVYYQARLSVGTHPGAFTQLSFLLDAEKYRYLRIKAGVSDGAAASARLNLRIYQGGVLIKNYEDVDRGSLFDDIDIDLNSRDVPEDPNNISIKVECQRAGEYCKLYFIDAYLVPNRVQPSDFEGRSQSTRPSRSDADNRSPNSTRQERQGNNNPRGNINVDDVINVIDTIRGIFR